MEDFNRQNDYENSQNTGNFESDLPNSGGLEKKNDINPKTVLVFLIVLAGASLFFAIANWFDTLKLPFAVKGVIPQVNLNTNQSDQQNIADLKAKDTDNDGLSDYDELYLYHTSPYLWSTAGDGVSDGEKVKKGLDPNCPIDNQKCHGTIYTNPNATSTPAVLDQSANLTPQQIRDLLIKNGMTADQLKNIDDATLVKLYQDTLAENQNQNTNAGIQIIPGDSTNTITPAQMRAMLITEGMDPNQVNQLTDSDLQVLWQQALQAQNNNNQK